MSGAEALSLILSIVGALAKIQQAREEGKKMDDAKVKAILQTAVSALEEMTAGLPAAIEWNNKMIDEERARARNPNTTTVSAPIAAESIVEAALIAAEGKPKPGG